MSGFFVILLRIYCVFVHEGIEWKILSTIEFFWLNLLDPIPHCKQSLNL